MSRQPGSLPDPSKPAGTGNDAMPFDHIVVVKMENHSFDNLLGELPRSGQPAADGLTFDSGGKATNTNPGTAATPAATVMDFLNPGQAAFISPPAIKEPRQ